MKANHPLLATLALGVGTHAAVWPAFDASTLENGQSVVIPNWELAPSSIISSNTSGLSIAGNGERNLWHRVPVSRCTLIGCLHAIGVPPWDNLGTVFFSDNLERYRDNSSFDREWLYRREFDLSPRSDRHFFLETHGITSRADISLNGEQIASRDTQAGAFGGHTYDITSVVSYVNALLITVYPTNYNYDFAQGFVDWNPYPPDNGTGIWRNITLKQTGPVLLNPMSVQTKFNDPKLSSADVTIRAIARNLENRTVTVDMAAGLFDPWSLKTLLNTTQKVDIPPHSSTEITITRRLSFPPVWWPWRWGKQSLVRAQINATVDGTLSDSRRNVIGIREVTSQVNKHGDLIFFVNKQPFQVLGAGYSPDMFLQWDSDHFEKICEYILDIGMNTIRLEGKMEQPELYDIADRLGIMVLPGWECCDKWEAWSYNDEISVSPFPNWTSADYATAGNNMGHEASMMQTHPSVLGFMVGSDFYPDDKATAIYVEALKKAGWNTPIISSGSQRGYPALLGDSGMKMDGPYDWVPPNYWWDTEPTSKRQGAAFGFGSELGAGVGTPEIGSLLKFLHEEEVDALWQSPNATSYHNGQGDTFSTRKIYNDALRARYGAPTGTADYLQKAQMVDYEATRAQFEAYAAKWKDAKRPATGMVYWMLNNAWPSLHWNLFDYYLRAAGSYFGAKTGNRFEHVAYDYERKEVYVINHAQSSEYLGPPSRRTVRVEAVDMNGSVILKQAVETQEEPNTSRVVMSKLHCLNRVQGVAFLRLELLNQDSQTLSRNVYWLAPETDKLAWDDSDWYYTPVKKYANYTALNDLPRANMTAAATFLPQSHVDPELRGAVNVTLVNHSPVPAVFVRLNLVNEGENDEGGPQRWEDVVPVRWQDNYVTLWPNETMVLVARLGTDVKAAYLQVDGKNVDTPEIVEIING